MQKPHLRAGLMLVSSSIPMYSSRWKGLTVMKRRDHESLNKKKKKANELLYIPGLSSPKSSAFMGTAWFSICTGSAGRKKAEATPIRRTKSKLVAKVFMVKIIWLFSFVSLFFEEKAKL